MGSLYSHYVVWQESGFRYFDELSEIDPEYSLEGLILKLKLQYFGHLMQRTDSGKDPDAGKDWGQEEKGDNRGWNGWMASPLDGQEFE